MILGFESLRRSTPVLAAALAAAAFIAGIVAAGAIRAPVQSRAIAASAASLPSAFGAAAGYSAEVVRVLDGDTFEARVRVWPGIEITTKVRLRGIDAPELRADCAEERARAITARDALFALLARGRVGVSGVRLDKYGGRVIADASADGTASIAEAMLAGGHVRRYSGGRRSGWCGQSRS